MNSLTSTVAWGAAAFAIALVLATILTPAMRRIAPLLGAVDHPGGRRVHTSAIPRLGGLAIILPFLAAVVALNAHPAAPLGVLTHSHRLLGLLGGGIFIGLAGAIDDVRAVGARRKLLLQVIAASIAWASGVRIEAIALPTIGTLNFGSFGLVITVVWILAFVNALNLIDGLDGLAGGVAFFCTITNVVGAMLTQEPALAMLNAALGGAVLGFVVYNFNPATIFMGDSGSMFLGYTLATMALLGPSQKATTLVSLLVPLVALGVPIVDTLFAIVRRFLERRPIFSADRGHIHHRLLDLGITHRRAVLIIYAATVLLCAGAIGVSFGHNWQVGLALLVVTVTLVALARFVGYFEYAKLRGRQRAGLRSSLTERLRSDVPSLLREMQEAGKEDELWLQLDRFFSKGDFVEVELRESSAPPQEGQDVLWTWASTETAPQRVPVVSVELSCETSSPPTSARVTWKNEDSDISPQVEILLQLVIDGANSARSRLARPAARRVIAIATRRSSP